MADYKAALKAITGDKPIAFLKSYAQLGGSCNAGVFLSQAIYWQSVTGEGEWFYKTATEWEEETTIKVDAQKAVRAKFRQLGILKEKKQGIPAKLYYQVDFEMLFSLLADLHNSDTPPQTSSGENPKQGKVKTPNSIGETTEAIKGTENTTEITTENKEKYKKEKIPKPEKPKTEKHRLPDDWVLSEKNRQYAKEQGFDDDFINLLAEGFADYWNGEDAKNPLKSDWDMTWRNYVRDRKMRGYGQKPKQQSSDSNYFHDLMQGCV